MDGFLFWDARARGDARVEAPSNRPRPAQVAALVYRRELGPTAATPLLHGFNAWAYVVVAANGCCGLAVSFMLRYADSIAKTYATALTIPATAAASLAFFHDPLGSGMVLGTGVMVISLAYFYAGETLFLAPQTPQEKDVTN